MLRPSPPEPAAQIPPWAGDFLLRHAPFALDIPGYVAAAVVATAYWVIPLLCSLADGTAIGSTTINRMTATLAAIGVDVGSIAEHFRPAAQAGDALTTAYLDDGTHFLFSLIISLGALTATETLKRFDRTVLAMARDKIPSVDVKIVARVYAAYRKAAFNPVYLVPCGLLAGAVWLLMHQLLLSDETIWWWGNRRYGVAGSVFAVMGALMVLASLWGAVILVAGSLMLARLMMLPLRLRPFHRDNCNGLAPLGRQIMLLWLNALLGGLAIYVALRLGYLGMQHNPLIWILALCGTLAIPAIAVVPLAASLRAVKRAQGWKLDRLEAYLDHCLAQSDAAIRDKDMAGVGSALQNLDGLQALFEIYRGVNVWPFNPKALTAIVGLNLVQIVLTTKEIISPNG